MTTQTFFAVKSKDGKIITRPVSSRSEAEQDKKRLQETLQEGATIVPVTDNGMELLLG